jgi:hypothetical protein
MGEMSLTAIITRNVQAFISALAAKGLFAQDGKGVGLHSGCV